MREMPPLVIRANAGTGKTFALSNRFLILMFEGVPPHQILATTFTRKAAGEIRSRIFQRLARAASSDSAAQVLSRELDSSRVTSARAAELLASLLREQHRLAICTIDSLCMGFLSMFAAELGFPAGVSILSDDQAYATQRVAVAEVLAHSDQGVLYALLRMLAQGVDRRALHGRLEEGVAKLHELFMESGASAWEGLAPLPRLSAPQIATAVEQLRRAPVGKNKKQEPSPKHVASVEAILAAVQAGQWTKLLDSGLGRAVWLDKDYSQVAVPEEMRAALAPLVTHAQSVVWDRVTQRTEALGRLLALYDTAYWSHCRAQGSFQFSDIKKLLVQGAVMGQLDELYYRLDTRYAHLLLDEFQDTSMLDWKLLQPIAAEVLSKVGVDNSFLCVGDVKQAIYGFRGGVAEIFDSITSQWEILKPETLDTSYRSAAPIMEFSNRVFGSLATNAAMNDFLEVARRWQRRYVTHRTARRDLEGYVQVDALPGNPKHRELDDLLLAAAVERVCQLYAQAPGASIAVLVPTNQDVRAVIQALARSRGGIVASQEGGMPLTDSAAVLAFLALFTLVDHPGDTVSRFHLSHSPLAAVCGVREDARDIEISAAMSKLRKKLIVDGYGEVVSELIRQTASLWTAEAHEQLLKLAELAFTFDARRGARAIEFVRLVERTKVDRPQGGGVRVMTYHKSKGLEFDAVVLPFLHGPFVTGKTQVWIDRSSPVEPPSRVLATVPQELAAVHPLLERVAAATQASQVMDALNRLYVALTRARQALYLIVPPAPSKPKKDGASESLSAAALIRAAIDAGPDADPLLAVGSPDWYRDCQRKPGIVSAEAALPAKITLAPPRKRVRTTTFVAPSSLEGGESCEVRQALFRESRGMEDGTIYHALFEGLEWLPLTAQDDAAGVRALERVVTDPQQRGAYMDNWRQMLRAPEIAAALDRGSYEASGGVCELFRELPFVSRDGQQLLRGAIDRVVVTRVSGVVTTVTVIDYKTDQIAPDMLSERVEVYRPQLEVYKKAVQQLFGLNQSQVRAQLLFTRLGSVWEL